MSGPSLELMNVQIRRDGPLHFLLRILRGTLQFLATAFNILAHALYRVATGEDTQNQQGQYCCGFFHVAAPVVTGGDCDRPYKQPDRLAVIRIYSDAIPAPKHCGITKLAMLAWRWVGLLFDRPDLSQQMPCQNNNY